MGAYACLCLLCWLRMIEVSPPLWATFWIVSSEGNYVCMYDHVSEEKRKPFLRSMVCFSFPESGKPYSSLPAIPRFRNFTSTTNMLLVGIHSFIYVVPVLSSIMHHRSALPPIDTHLHKTSIHCHTVQEFQQLHSPVRTGGMDTHARTYGYSFNPSCTGAILAYLRRWCTTTFPHTSTTYLVLRPSLCAHRFIDNNHRIHAISFPLRPFILVHTQGIHPFLVHAHLPVLYLDCG